MFAHLSAMLCSDFETWNTAHLLARMAGEGYGALLPPSAATVPPGRRLAAGGLPTAVAPLNGAASGVDAAGTVAAAAAGEPGGWVVLRKHLLQWLLAVSARCGDARASSEYFAGLAELMAALEEERRKADRESVFVFCGDTED